MSGFSGAFVGGGRGGGGGGDVVDDDDASLALAHALQAEEEAAAAAGASRFGGAGAGAGGIFGGGDKDSLHPSSHSPSPSPSSSPWLPRAPPGVCPGCSRSTALSFGGTISTLGAVWHASCFKCGACHEAIAEPRFAVKDGVAYHRRCYRASFHPRCLV